MILIDSSTVLGLNRSLRFGPNGQPLPSDDSHTGNNKCWFIPPDFFFCVAQTACEDDSVDGCGRGLDLGTPPARRTENIGEETDVSAWNTIKRNT